MPRPSVPKGLPDRLSPQLATLVDAPPKGAGWTYEIKLDGYRILARVGDGKVQLVTRNGNDWTAKMPHIASAAEEFVVESAWLDGEVVVMGDNGMPDFNALQNAFDKRSTGAYNLLRVRSAGLLNGKDLRPLEFRQRLGASGIAVRRLPWRLTTS